MVLVNVLVWGLCRFKHIEIHFWMLPQKDFFLLQFKFKFTEIPFLHIDASNVLVQQLQEQDRQKTVTNSDNRMHWWSAVHNFRTKKMLLSRLEEFIFRWLEVLWPMLDILGRWSQVGGQHQSCFRITLRWMCSGPSFGRIGDHVNCKTVWTILTESVGASWQVHFGNKNLKCSTAFCIL